MTITPQGGNDAERSTDANGRRAQGGSLGDYVKAESMLQIAIALPAGVVIGWLLGAWLGRHFHQSWMGIAGLVLGAIAGFVQMFVTAARFLRRGD